MSILRHIRLPLIALLKSIIDYIQDLQYEEGALTPSTIAALDLENGPSPFHATSPLPQCKHCNRPQIPCTCNNIHCFYHKKATCPYNANLPGSSHS
jgi:hypothetical protein